MGKSNISQKDAYKLMLKEYPDIMTVEQMCEVLGISTKTGYRLLREKKICCLKVGRAYRIPKAHLFTYYVSAEKKHLFNEEYSLDFFEKQ